ncbi:hypothetical protein CLOSTASPAR_04350 [[Clostridium] asparagiforme DSM 15981]|uniref:Uncharacterized protein n=1 Tax=[Clostridium] asparagiforme DSM 15981 TaxID=518636 RepID=C0D504_9FIRM|nr:hypothetical protein CLOSTASPAR_04350 [[Clostridium] asparagiforme DSM 15981]
MLLLFKASLVPNFNYGTMVWFDAFDRLSPSPLRGGHESPAGGSRIAEMRWGPGRRVAEPPGDVRPGRGIF